MLRSSQTKRIHRLTPPRFRDYMPSFDPDGKFIYFISYREFNPVYDSMHFDLNFPRGMRPYAIALAKDTPSPFIQQPMPPDNGKKKSEPADTEILNNSQQLLTH
jgi:tricorn protease